MEGLKVDFSFWSKSGTYQTKEYSALGKVSEHASSKHVEKAVVGNAFYYFLKQFQTCRLFENASMCMKYIEIMILWTSVGNAS